MALTVPTVPTGMNAGVSISPREVVMRPRRAMPSVLRREKGKSVIGRRPTTKSGKTTKSVIPAKAGNHLPPRRGELDPGYARNDTRWVAASRLLLFALLLAEQQRGIPVRIEPVLEPDGVRIRCLHGLEAGESRDQHEQSRFRQVEVGHQRVDHAEAEARGDEDIGLADERLQLAGRPRRRLQQPHACRADGDDPAALR